MDTTLDIPWTEHGHATADAFKARRAAQKLKELRGVYVPIEHEKSIKQIIREMVKGLADRY